jgi:hypothetical protein
LHRSNRTGPRKIQIQCRNWKCICDAITKMSPNMLYIIRRKNFTIGNDYHKIKSIFRTELPSTLLICINSQEKVITRHLRNKLSFQAVFPHAAVSLLWWSMKHPKFCHALWCFARNDVIGSQDISRNFVKAL